MRFLKDYLSPLMKWWWLVITAPVIAAMSAYLFARQLPPVYQARTTLLIGRAIQDPNPSGTEFGLSYQLASEYANMAMREPVRNAAKAALGLSELPEYEATPRGIFLEIAVIHTDPKFAQVVANVLTQQLILLSPVNTQQTSGEDQQFVQQQLKELQANIEQTRQEIVKKQESLSKLDSALDIAKTDAELKALEGKISTLQTIYSDLFASTREAAFNTLVVFDTASLPTKPIGPKKTLIVLLAAVSGLAFAVGAAYLIEFLDDTIKGNDEISRLIDVPAIGFITEMQGFKPTFVADQPRSPVADAFRGLRTNLEFSAVDRPLKKLVISSAEASDGKSTIAINLAIVMAQSEKKVILLDADLRSPSIHRYLGIPDNPGLSDVFLDRVKIKDVLVEWSGTPKFKVIPAGATPPNSAELLGSRKMDLILEELSGMADIVIVDGPPGFVVDAVVLAAKVDGVLLVVNIGETRRGSIKMVTEQFRRIGANLVGVVLNRVARGSAYYGSYYYSTYYSKEPATRPLQSKSKIKMPKLRLKSLSLKSLSRFLPKKKQSNAVPLTQFKKSPPVIVQAYQTIERPPEAVQITQTEDRYPEAVLSTQTEEKILEAVQPTQAEGIPPEVVQPSRTKGKRPKVFQSTQTKEKTLEAVQPTQTEERPPEVFQSTQTEEKTLEVALSTQTEEKPPEAIQPTRTKQKRPKTVRPTRTEEKTLEAVQPTQTEGRPPEAVQPTQAEGIPPEVVQPTQTEEKTLEVALSTQTEEKPPEAVQPTRTKGKRPKAVRPTRTTESSV